MIEVMYRYRVHPAQVQAFEHAYGQTGPWVQLFAGQPGYRRTRLFRHKSETGVYVTVDAWDSKGAWDTFRSANKQAYDRLCRQLRLLFLEEHLLGYYEGIDEYRAPLDIQA